MKIFIVEDNKTIRMELTTLLEKYGYTLLSSENYKDIVNEIVKSVPDLIILDINLPYMDGYYICRSLRERVQIPIIIVTSRNNEADELISMNLGADDFITKPYNAQILMARINAVLKRTKDNTRLNDTLVYDGVSLNLSKSIISFGSLQAELTKNELRILTVLFQNKGKIVSRNDLMDALWQSNQFIDDNTLTVNVNRLRKKLDEIGKEDFIRTKRGLGYII